MNFIACEEMDRNAEFVGNVRNNILSFACWRILETRDNQVKR